MSHTIYVTGWNGGAEYELRCSDSPGDECHTQVDERGELVTIDFCNVKRWFDNDGMDTVPAKLIGPPPWDVSPNWTGEWLELEQDQ